MIFNLRSIEYQRNFATVLARHEGGAERLIVNAFLCKNLRRSPAAMLGFRAAFAMGIAASLISDDLQKNVASRIHRVNLLGCLGELLRSFMQASKSC